MVESIIVLATALLGIVGYVLKRYGDDTRTPKEKALDKVSEATERTQAFGRALVDGKDGRLSALARDSLDTLSALERLRKKDGNPTGG